MYTEAPTEEITLDEFELFALDRLMVLRKIEDLKARYSKLVSRASVLTNSISRMLAHLVMMQRHARP